MSIVEESRLALMLLAPVGWVLVKTIQLAGWKVNVERDLAEIRKQAASNKDRDKRIEDKIDRGMHDFTQALGGLDTKIARLVGQLQGAGVINGGGRH